LHVTLLEAVNLLLVCVLKDDPAVIGTVTLRSNDLLMTVVMSDL
jgi:hypothetical protein